ncbi:hypothetical protein AA313_de0207036 [Arthrobotrys entomopaga]|nr:hypothetical protein AA313_de0207036 [Arthrobotrys entomopaga]
MHREKKKKSNAVSDDAPLYFRSEDYSKWDNLGYFDIGRHIGLIHSQTLIHLKRDRALAWAARAQVVIFQPLKSPQECRLFSTSVELDPAPHSNPVRLWQANAPRPMFATKSAHH